VLICVLGQNIAIIIINFVVKARNGTKIGPDFLVSRVLKSYEKVLIFILIFEWDPVTVVTLCALLLRSLSAIAKLLAIV